MHDTPGAFEKLQNNYLAANDLMNQGEYEKAIELWNEGIVLDDNFRYQYVSQFAMRGVSYFNIGKYTESIEDYKKALEMEPNYNNSHVDYYYTMGGCYLELKEWDNALEVLDKAVELNPQDYEAVLSRGDAYIGLEQLQNALIDYELVIAHLDGIDSSVSEKRDELREKLGLAPANPKLKELCLTGSELIGEEKYTEAIETYTEAINLDDNFRYNHVTNYAMRGHCYMCTEEHEEAINDFEKAIEMEPNLQNSHADYYARMGRSYGPGLGDFENSIACYTKSIELKPDNYEAILFRGYGFLNAEKKQEALNDFELVIENIESIDQQTLDLRDQLREELGLEPVASSDEPELFPGEPIATLSDYVTMMKKMQAGDMNGALAEFGLDMMQYGEVAQKWGQLLASDPNLTQQYAEMMAN